MIIGSKWPTLQIYYEKGIPDILGSTVDFDYLSFNATQTFNIGTLGKSLYKISGGSFITQDSVYYIDRKFFRQSDEGFLAWIFSDPLNSFQNLNASYETRDWYGQLHYIHHFNGAIINKVPFMKKTGIKAVAGIGILYLPEYDHMVYQEGFFGVERIFKIFRKRLRLGGFAVLSNSNIQGANVKFKIAVDIMDENNLKFNF